MTRKNLDMILGEIKQTFKIQMNCLGELCIVQDLTTIFLHIQSGRKGC